MAVVGDQFDECNPASFGAFGGTSGAADAGNWRGSGDAGPDSGVGNKATKQPPSNEPEICGEQPLFLLGEHYMTNSKAAL